MMPGPIDSAGLYASPGPAVGRRGRSLGRCLAERKGIAALTGDPMAAYIGCERMEALPLVLVIVHAGQARQVEHPLDLVFADQDLARLGSVQWPDDPSLLHHLHDPRRPRVADAEPPLQHRSGRLPVVDHKPDCLLEKGVVHLLFGPATAVAPLGTAA